MESSIPAEFLQENLVQQPGDWTCGPLRGNEDEMVRWIKVVEIPSADLILGLSDHGDWVRGGGASVEVASGPQAITLLPCLEVPWEEFGQALRSGLTRLGLPRRWEETFPLDQMVVAGLTSGSEFWTKLALDRVQEGWRADLRLRGEPVAEALQAASASAPSQNLRHRAQALLKAQKRATAMSDAI